MILDAAATRRPRGTAPVAASPERDDGPPAPSGQELSEVDARLQAAGLDLVAERELAPDALRALREAGKAVRLSGRWYAHATVVADAADSVRALIESQGAVSLGEVRDALGISRKGAQALLEHLDATRVTRRGADDRRTLRRSARAGTTA